MVNKNKNMYMRHENFISGVRFLVMKVNPEGLPVEETAVKNKIPSREKKKKNVRVENPGLSGWRLEL